MNEKFFLGLEDNFEVESRMVEYGTQPNMMISNLSETEKAEIFGEKTVKLDFLLDAIEMTR